MSEWERIAEQVVNWWQDQCAQHSELLLKQNS